MFCTYVKIIIIYYLTISVISELKFAREMVLQQVFQTGSNSVGDHQNRLTIDRISCNRSNFRIPTQDLSHPRIRMIMHFYVYEHQECWLQFKWQIRRTKYDRQDSWTLRRLRATNKTEEIVESDQQRCIYCS